MSTLTDNDLKELKNLMNDCFTELRTSQEKTNDKLNDLNDKLNDLKVDIAILKEGQNSLNKRLEDTQSSINKRLEDTQSSINKRLEDTQSSISKRLEDNQSSINKRIDNLDFIARTIIASVAVALLVGFAKLLFPNLVG